MIDGGPDFLCAQKKRETERDTERERERERDVPGKVEKTPCLALN